MNEVLSPTGLLVKRRPGCPLTLALNMAVRQFYLDRPEAEPTEVRLNPATANGLNAEKWEAEAGVKVVRDRLISESKIQVLGWEAAE